MTKVSAIIPTYNEEHNIADAISTVNWCDEIIVVDSFSTDNTVEIANGLGAKVLSHKYEHSAAQKNWVIPQAKNEWIVLLDADERMSPELNEEIKNILSSDQKKSDAYWIFRENHFLGKKIKYSGWQNDKVIRLFKRDNCRYENK
ncbi:MAG: glycosyltransferase involved in cell wall biosynthesis, partial [Flavobacteriales bacterium]